jgi:DNA-binding response OmpR family regulator
LADRLESWLTHERHNVECVVDGAQALERLQYYKYDVVILDLMLPDVSGVEVCKKFRADGGRTPILMLTGRNQISDKEQGLDAGADDYLTKPFEPRELSARLRALLRRSPEMVSNSMQAGNLVLEMEKRRVTQNGAVIQLLPLEFALLEFLMRHPGQVFSPEALLDRVWGSKSDASIDALRTYIKTLRKKIQAEGEPALIRTVHGVGYKFEA